MAKTTLKSIWNRIVQGIDSLNRRQLSLIITVLSMAIVVLLLYNVQLGGVQKEEYVVEMLVLEEEIPLEEEQQETEASTQERVKSHRAYNETAKRSYGNPEPLKTLEELREEQESSEENPSDSKSDLASDYAANLQKLAEKRKAQEQQYGDSTAETLERLGTTNKNASVSYSLVNRTHRKLPVPIYTCIEGGKVVVNIQVDAQGRVVEASINENSSTTSNGCLEENAIAYALRARFNTSTKGAQIGTITYLFQGK